MITNISLEFNELQPNIFLWLDGTLNVILFWFWVNLGVMAKKMNDNLSRIRYSLVSYLEDKKVASIY